jgi:hypothetical protein
MIECYIKMFHTFARLVICVVVCRWSDEHDKSCCIKCMSSK